MFPYLNVAVAHVVIWSIALVIVAISPFDTQAHGGVSIEDDSCIMTIGPYRAHFSGYQPRLRASQEFCEDIPAVADAIIVLDFISLPLRAMQVDFRVVRDVNNIGVNATYEDLGSAGDIDAATVVYRAAERYRNGNFDVTLNFDTAGSFIGILTATAADSGTAYVSVFPFSVGKTDMWQWLKWVLAIVVLGGLGLLLFAQSGSRASKCVLA